VLSSMRIENRVWVAIVVIMFAGIPFIPVDLATIRFDTTRSAQCQVSVPLPNDTGWANVYTGAQQPERAGAGVVVLHARAVESRDGRRGGGDSLRHRPASDSHGCRCHAHR